MIPLDDVAAVLTPGARDLQGEQKNTGLFFFGPNFCEFPKMGTGKK
jgi:hypothetical protein